jgi:hypothetical protein
VSFTPHLPRRYITSLIRSAETDENTPKLLGLSLNNALLQSFKIYAIGAVIGASSSSYAAVKRLVGSMKLSSIEAYIEQQLLGFDLWKNGINTEDVVMLSLVTLAGFYAVFVLMYWYTNAVHKPMMKNLR